MTKNFEIALNIPNNMEFQKKHALIINALEYEAVKKCIPFNLDDIKKAFAIDKNLNSLSLSKWDHAAGFITSGLKCNFVGSQLTSLYSKIGVTSFSCADGVCILKQCARMWAEESPEFQQETKTISFGKYDCTDNGKRDNEIEIEINLEYKKQKPVFSVSGRIWNNLHTDIICGGQCLDEMKSHVHNPVFNEIYDLWKKYHLNDLHAGTKEQEKAIEKWKNQGNVYNYEEACDYLKRVGLYEVNHNGNPYKYGHGWIYEPIPQYDLDRIYAILEIKD